MRDAFKTLNSWHDQLLQLREEIASEYSVFLSVYENDSIDGTELVFKANKEALDKTWSSDWVGTATRLGTQRYSSVWNADRMRNLAAARQQCLNQVGDRLAEFDKIAYIEPDVTYSPRWCAELILARHPAAAGLPEPDIYSGWSLRSETHPKESAFLYDTCATRQRPEDTCWDFVRDGTGVWRGESLIPTGLSGVEANSLHRVWSTFNCFCVYNAKPFIEGAKWDYVNRRLDTHQQRVGDGWLDADTSVICEDFRARGYTDIYLNTNCLIRHV